ncbi:hypothetical protein CONPUDRAFT_153996 [Coniophora puteana RWD-64-598 SS2]|uniref:Uncharacterized protein n=1 Tax=Coniophora puteana (strain RWD-64-598) TaxID=741705 RepID=A0A5M3MSE4_CONPW|nr:uncharacterized protein CONPUDRAFT_153996 [Coniophora puteana RWD-64-598 SS2]EIW81451.1 hypothetical protein CONPUDRAFT_153996 [Coniophora puteana RWD-64-598 SS2]
MSHRVLHFRWKAVELLVGLASNTTLPKRLSPRTAADILRALYTLALQDPKAISDQLTNPETLWQYFLLNLDENDPWNKDEQSQILMTNRLLGELQDGVLDTARELMVMNAQPSPRYYLDVLKQKPPVIDLLLECILIEPPHCNPEGTVTYKAMINLAAFFRWPSSMLVPGISAPDEQSMNEKDWKALLQSMQVLTSRKDWSDLIIQGWIRTEPDAEDLEKRNQSIISARLLFSEENFPIDEKELNMDLAITSAQSRVSLLRVITMLTHGADAIGVRNVDIYSLLPMAYCASQNPQDTWEGEICLRPSWTYLQDNYEQDIKPYYVASEKVIGPTAYARLLVALAQRNALKGVQSLRKAPARLSSTTSIAQLHQITHPDVISCFLDIATVRVQSAMEKAEKITGKHGPIASVQARFVWASAGELAAALVTFDDLTGGEYATEEATKTRQILVVVLNKLSAAALGTKKYKQVYYYLLAAVRVSDSIKEPLPDWSAVSDRIKKQVKHVKRIFETQPSADVSLALWLYCSLETAHDK